MNLTNALTDMASEKNLMNVNIDTYEVTGETNKAKGIAEIQSSLIMAKRFPRTEATSIKRLFEALNRQSLAEKASYKIKRGDGFIEGPSVILAREAARCWENIKYGTIVLPDSGNMRTVEGYAWDLETNTYTSGSYTFKKLIQRKNKASGKTEWVEPNETELRELTNKHGSICERNALLKIIPGDIIDEARSISKKNLANRIDKKNIQVTRSQVLQGFEHYGVKQTDLEAHLNLDIERWSPESIADLQIVFNSLKAGEITALDLIKEPQAKKTDLNSIEKTPTQTKSAQELIQTTKKKEKEDVILNIPQFDNGIDDYIQKVEALEDSNTFDMQANAIMGEASRKIKNDSDLDLLGEAIESRKKELRKNG